MAGGQVKSKKQKSREAAVNRLMKEISLARKAAEDFLKTAGAAERRAGLLGVGYTAVKPCSECTYDTYKCICSRLKTLESLLESMELTAKHLGGGQSYLN